VHRILGVRQNARLEMREGVIGAIGILAIIAYDVDDVRFAEFIEDRFGRGCLLLGVTRSLPQYVHRTGVVGVSEAEDVSNRALFK